MLHYLGSVVCFRPKTTILALLLVLVLGAGAGGYGYALHQWREAQKDVKEGRLDEARPRLALCLRVWPRSAEVHLLAARVDRLNEDFAGAEAHLKTCIRLQNGPTEATQVEFLLMRAQRGEEEEVADQLFRHVDNNYPESSLILETLARAYMHRLRYGPAYACLNRWLKEEPNNPRIYYWLGWVLERLDNHTEAMVQYKKSLELGPDQYAVRLRVAEMLVDDNQPLDAIPHLERLRKQFPDRPEVLARLGQCRFLQGEESEARQLLEAAVQKLPDDPAILLHLAKLDMLEDQPAVAEKRLRHAIKLNPADTEAMYTLISCLQLQGRRPEAAAMEAQYKETKKLLDRANLLLKEEARRPTTDATVPSELGSILLRIGEEQQGLNWLDQALLRDPQHRPTHQILADYFDKKGERDKAALHRRQAGDQAKKPAGT